MPEQPAGQPRVSALFKRPESVLVVVYTQNLETLIICRKRPAGFWQSVTGSLESDELPADAAQRELMEETGIDYPVIDHGQTRVFPISSAWRKRYAPGVTENVEHEFSVQLPSRCAVRLDPTEHVQFQWLPLIDAIGKVSSHTNRAALKGILNVEG